jgi:hypothetical protein
MADILVIPSDVVTTSETSMTLSEVVDMFVEASGRNDLDTESVVMNAAFFINQGCRELDRRLFGGKTNARYTVDLAAAQILVPVPNCRAITDVWIYDSAEKTRLTKADDIYEMKEYYSEPKASITPDTPFVYFPVNARPSPGAVEATSYSQEWAFEDIIEEAHEGFNSLLISPPPDHANYTLQVEGVFYSDELEEDDDYNWWTVNHPLLVVQAALFKLEEMYRNTEGAKDWDNAISKTMIQLNSDWIEEEIADIDQMEG